ncbi:hypothetical protein MKEN_01338000 [Mycena kentingensis (nom. inval.)]|nr:hypothetical protein MKEN_01338000 [Mycena kentingensis (nom. inval.)]
MDEIKNRDFLSYMHPSLQIRLSDLRKLPPNIRDLASSAAGGSSRSTVALYNRLKFRQPPIPQRNPPSLAPVLYATIDPAQLDTLRDLEAHDPTRWIDTFKRAVYGFLAFFPLLDDDHAVHAGAQVDIWNRTWLWLLFFDELRDLLPAHPKDIVLGYGACFSLCKALTREQTRDTLAPVISTKGFYRVAIRGMDYFIRHGEDDEMAKMAELFFTTIPGNPEEADKRYLAELLDGAGDRTELARIIVGTLNYVVPNFDKPDRPLPQPSMALLGGFYGVYRYLLKDHDLCMEAVDQRLVGKLTIIIRALSVTPEAPAGIDTLDLILDLFHAAIDLPPHSGNMQDALTNDILRGVFQGAQKRNVQRRNEKLRPIIARILELTSNFSVICSLEAALERLADWDPTVAFNGPLLQDWTELVDVAEERFDFLDEFCEGERADLRGVRQPKVLEGRRQKRNQTEDYRPYHRARCAGLRKNNDAQLVLFDPSERSFYKALLTHDYTTHRRSIALKLVAFFRQHPAPLDIPCVVFGYASGRCAISVVPYTSREEDFAGAAPVYEPPTEEYGFSAGNGKMVIHVLELQHGKHRMVFPYRMRFSSGEFMCGIRRLAEGMPPLNVNVPDDPVVKQRCRQEVDRLLRLTVKYTH